MSKVIVSTEEVKQVIEELKEASRLYYLADEDSFLSDEEFDAKQDFLQIHSEDFPELFAPGTDGFKILEGDVLLGAEMDEMDGEDVVHKSPMLSLAKAKKPEQLDSYLKKVRGYGAKDFRLQAKLDGIAASAIYNKGNLTFLATRGSGTIGKNITHLVKDKNIIVKGLPTTINSSEYIEVRGEIFMFDEQFEQTNKNRFEFDETKFEVSRNATFGIINRSKKGMKYKAEMTFAAYSVWNENSIMSLSHIDVHDNFITVDKLTLDTVNKIDSKSCKLSNFANNEEIHQAIESFGKLSHSFDFPIDGVVIKPVDEVALHKTMGNTSHHPSSQIAWKYPSEKVETKITEIINTVGKSGRVTPVALFDTVMLDNSKVSRASLHNFSLVSEKDVRPGSIVIVEKANEIIPQIVSVISSPEDSRSVEVPKNCPSCGSVLYFDKNDSYPPKTLSCENELCPARNFESLVFAVGSDYLNIKGLSASTLDSLHKVGIVNDISDLFYLDENSLANTVVGVSSKGEDIVFGQKRTKNILEYLEKAKNLPAEVIIASFGIPKVGRLVSKKLIHEFSSLDNILKASIDEVAAIDGMGEILAENTIKGLTSRIPMIQRMREAGVLFKSNEHNEDKNNEIVNNSSSLNNLSFAISGVVPSPFAKRNDWVDFVESQGGEFHSSPKASTSYMIADKNGSSSKVKKAVSLGIEFMSAEEFTKNFVN